MDGSVQSDCPNCELDLGSVHELQFLMDSCLNVPYLFRIHRLLTLILRKLSFLMGCHLDGSK